MSDFEDPRRVLARHGLGAKRSMSQNFLVSPSAVEKIVAALELEEGAGVVELGPGLGTLTKALLAKAGRVIAIERDRDMIAVLEAELGGGALEVREGDAAAVDLGALSDELGAPASVVGNLPYAITGAILRNVCAHRGRIRVAVVMVQREVASRLTASPAEPAYGALTVFVQAGFRVERVLRVPAGAFHPAPKVDSAVVRLSPLCPPRAIETPAFRLVVRAAFAQRRKTLRNALRGAGLDKDVVEAALERAGIDGRARGETLSVEDFARLAEAALPGDVDH